MASDFGSGSSGLVAIAGSSGIIGTCHSVQQSWHAAASHFEHLPIDCECTGVATGSGVLLLLYPRAEPARRISSAELLFPFVSVFIRCGCFVDALFPTHRWQCLLHQNKFLQVAKTELGTAVDRLVEK